MTIRYVARTDVGRMRDHNEDAIGEPKSYVSGTPSRGWLFAIADGLGGHAGGEVASRVAVRALFDAYYESKADPSGALSSALTAANAAVRDAGTAALARAGSPHGSTHRMGTTLVACLIVDEHLFGVNVGDSRAYLLHNGALTLLTHDQTLVAEQVRQRVITLDEARQSRFRSVLLQCLGHASEIDPEFFDTRLTDGDRILLCSDGLHGVVDDDTISAHLAEPSIDAAANALIEEANSHGGPDNISVIVIEHYTP